MCSSDLLHVVEEDAFALHEPPVLLARNVRAREAGRGLLAFDDDGPGHRLGHVDAGETMFPPRAPFFTGAQVPANARAAPRRDAAPPNWLSPEIGLKKHPA